jgi:cyclohexanone monooxygenase
MKESMTATAEIPTATRSIDAIIVGAGFSGLYMLHRLRGLGLSALVLEAGGDVGGTWYWNRYPGARCDIESMDYSYSFDEALQQEWQWMERFAAQPEILRYAEHVADRFELRRDIQFDTRVTAAHYMDQDRLWLIETDLGETFRARFCIMATGCLSVPNRPPIPGLDQFSGPIYQTGAWPHAEIDFSGQRVGVIGTGSSAIQSIPLIAEQADELMVFQRTPNYSVPAHNKPLAPEEERAIKEHYAEYRQANRESRVGYVVPVNRVSAMEFAPEAREREYEIRWQRGGLGFTSTFNDLLISPESNETAAAFFRRKIREIVRDPVKAEMLTTMDYPLGTKRICVDTCYYETFNREHVTLVDLRQEPIVALTENSVQTASREFPLDSLVLATGFDAMTGALLRIDILGRGGTSLRDVWADGPRTYLGLTVAGFPNMFMITGPGSPSVISNMMVSIEQHVEWIADCLAAMRRRGLVSIEATDDAQAGWVAHVNEEGNSTLYPRSRSWYTGANIASKPRVFMPYVGGVGAYRNICQGVADKGYEGFALSGR